MRVFPEVVAVSDVPVSAYARNSVTGRPKGPAVPMYPFGTNWASAYRANFPAVAVGDPVVRKSPS